MSSKRVQTSIEVRELIIKHYQIGMSVREIGDAVQRSHSTVHDIIKRFKTSNSVENKTKSGQPKKFTPSDERWIVNQIKKNPKLSAPKLTNLVSESLQISVNPETVRNVLRKHNFHGRVAFKKPFVNDVNRKKRLKFAFEHRNHDFSYWSNVLFTDESKYNVFRSDGQAYVWRKPNEELKAYNLRPTIKHGSGSVMVWGCMSATGPGQLVFIDGIMDQFKYISILRENLAPSVEKLGISENYKFYQGNDPKHKAHNTRMWLLYNCPHVIETPPQSPDINVIENLENKLKSRTISNISQLKIALKEEWEQIDPAYCKKLVESIPRRLEAVRKSKGMPTKY